MKGILIANDNPMVRRGLRELIEHGQERGDGGVCLR